MGRCGAGPALGLPQQLKCQQQLSCEKTALRQECTKAKDLEGLPQLPLSHLLWPSFAPSSLANLDWSRGSSFLRAKNDNPSELLTQQWWPTQWQPDCPHSECDWGLGRGLERLPRSDIFYSSPRTATGDPGTGVTRGQILGSESGRPADSTDQRSIIIKIYE